MVVQRLAPTKDKNAAAQDIQAMPYYGKLVADFISKKDNCVETGALFSKMKELSGLKVTRAQLEKSKGEKLIDGKGVMAKGKVVRREIEAWIAKHSHLMQKTHFQKLLSAEEDGQVAPDSEDDPDEYTFEGDSGDTDYSKMLATLLLECYKIHLKDAESVVTVEDDDDETEGAEPVDAPSSKSKQSNKLSGMPGEPDIFTTKISK